MPLNPNIFASTAALLREIRRDPQLWSRSLAVSWFWMVGAVALSLTPVVIRNKTGGGIGVETAISALFALGIGIGSIAAALIAQGRILLRQVPLAAVGMAAFWSTSVCRPGASLRRARKSVSVSFSVRAIGVRIAVDVVGLSGAGGLFVVPLFTAIQVDVASERRARVVGGVNILNSALIVGGVLATAALQSKVIGLTEPVLLASLGALTLGAAFYVSKYVSRRVYY
ncbi:MAG: hypothetical protein WDN46_23835 [Methylocella sp.]